MITPPSKSLITSQNATAPKLPKLHCADRDSLITSQNATAPKHKYAATSCGLGLITSQNATAPKPACRTRRGPQTIYNGNAPEEGDNSAVFERIRSDALSGKTKRTAWTEWSIGSSREVPDVSDRSMWERTNPSVGVLISFDTIEAEFESEDPVQFAHQRLGWFRDRGGEKGLFGQEEWDALEVEDAPESWDKLV